MKDGKIKALKYLALGVIFITIFFSSVPNARADDVVFSWAKKMGNTLADIGNSVVLDSSGNVYTTGTFTGTVDFDPGAGTSNLTSAGLTDIFVSKLDSSGNFVWAKQIGGLNADIGRFIALDSSGNVYTTGQFEDIVDFDPGAGTSNLTSVGSSDIFISKLDSSGTFVWAKQIGGTNTDLGKFIALDSSGNVYTTGQFDTSDDPVDFDPGAGTSNLTSAGSNDIFISKLDSSGNFVWAEQMGGTSQDGGNYLVLDSSGNVYTTGTFNGTADFDPGVGTSNLVSAGGTDIFISKLDSSGNFVWVKQIGGTGADVDNSITLDSSSNVYSTGSFTGTVDFDPGVGTSNLVSAGGTDIFISKLDSSGTFVSAKQMGGTGADLANTIFLDSGSNMYTTGSFASTADFDPGAGTSNLVSAGGNDIFISKLDSSGTFVWAKQIGGTGNDIGKSMTVDSSGNVYTTGQFAGTVDFDPGAGTSNLVASGSTDIFVSKLIPLVNVSPSLPTSLGGASYVDGSRGNDNTPTLSFSLSDPNGSDTVKYQIQIDDTSNFSSTVVDYTSALAAQGSTSFTVGQVAGSGSYTTGSGGQTLTEGSYYWRVKAIDNSAAESSYETANSGSIAFIIDTTAPVISEITPVTTPTNDNTPNYTFTTNEAGTISYDGDCTSLTTSASSGSNTITFSTLGDGAHSNCTVRVTDTATNQSNLLSVTAFTIDTTAPIISEVIPVPTPSTDTTPDYTFTTNEAGDITYGGSCASVTTSAIIGANTITFDALALGTYADCTITVTDDADNDSNTLAVTSFTIAVPASGGGSSGSSSRKIILAPGYPTVPIVTPTDCKPNDNFSSLTGLACPVELPSDFKFLNDLHIGMTHPDVKKLQEYLNDRLWILPEYTGPGSKGKETNFFGNVTKSALIKLQKSFNINPAVGFFGPITRALVNGSI